MASIGYFGSSFRSIMRHPPCVSLAGKRRVPRWCRREVLAASAVPREGRVRSAKGKDGMRHIALQARSNGLDLPYQHWLTSSLTAVHTLTKATVDMRGTTDIDGMLGSLEQYCIKHRQHSFSRAVEALVKELYPKRMTHMPQK